MSVKDFALNVSAAERITIHWAVETEPVTVLINGTILGTLTSEEKKGEGKDFILPDKSLLHVQFFNEQPQAFRAGVPLFALAPVVDVSFKQRQQEGCLKAWLILNLIVGIVVTAVNSLMTLGALGGNSVSTSPLVFVLLGLLGIVWIMGASLLLAWKKLGFYLMLDNVLIGTLISVFFKSTNIGTTFASLAGIGILYFWLKRSGIWENLK